MSYFQLSTDASYLYRPTSAVGTGQAICTAVPGNIMDLMRNGVLVRGTFVAPMIAQINDPVPDTHVRQPQLDAREI